MAGLTLLTGFGHENFGSRLMFETVLARLPEAAPPVVEMPRGEHWHAWYQGYVLMPSALLRRGLDRWCQRLSPRTFARLGFKLPEDCAQVLDISGYAHDHGQAAQLMRNKLHILQRARAAGARITFLPHSLSIRDERHRPLFAALYAQADTVFLRDAYSEQLARALASPAELRYCTDFVLWHPRLDTAPRREATVPRDTLVLIPNFKAQTASLLATARRMLDRHRHALRQVVIVSFYAGETAAYLKGLADALGTDIEVRIEAAPERVFSLFERARLCVSARYHGCCLAIYSGVPLVTVGWSEKYESLLQTWQYPRPADEEDAVAMAEAYHAGPYPAIRARHLAAVQSMFAELRAAGPACA